MCICYFFETIINIMGECLKFIGDNFVEILALGTTIITARVNYKFLKKQDEKISRNDSINRKANFQSILILSEKIEMILNLDSWHNFTESLPYKNVLFKDANTKNGQTYAFNIYLYLKNLTNIFPSKISVHELKIWDNSTNPKEKIKQINLDFINYHPGYKEVTINGNKETCIDVMCCCEKEELLKFQKYNNKNRLFNFRVEMSVKNSCGILNECVVRGKFKLNSNKQDLSDGNIGGTKEKLMFEVIDSYLNVLKIEEESNE